MILCYDTADENFRGGVPSDAPSIIFYVDGRYANGTAARSRFPHLFTIGRAIGLTVFQRVPAEGDDFEPGNKMGDAGDWVVKSHAQGVARPIVYMDENDWEVFVRPSLEREFGTPLPPPGPNRPFRTILAHPDGIPEIPPDHDGKQFWFSSLQGHGQGDMDKSVLRDDFFLGTPVNPPNPPGEVMAIATYTTSDHRVGIAVETDKQEVLHIEQQAPAGDWWRHKDGTPNWLSLGTPAGSLNATAASPDAAATTGPPATTIIAAGGAAGAAK